MGWATRPVLSLFLSVLFSSGCCCVPDVRRIIHQSRRGTIAWLSLTYQWPGAARSFACALNHPFTLYELWVQSIHLKLSRPAASNPSHSGLSFLSSTLLFLLLSLSLSLSLRTLFRSVPFYFIFIYSPFFLVHHHSLLFPPVYYTYVHFDRFDSGAADELNESSPGRLVSVYLVRVVSCCAVALALHRHFEAEAFIFDSSAKYMVDCCSCSYRTPLAVEQREQGGAG